MTDEKSAQVYRKVWLSTEMKEAVLKLCALREVKPSPLIVSMVDQIVEDPRQFEGSAVPPAGPNYISIYTDEEKWSRGDDEGVEYGVSLGALIRVALAKELALEGIPWHVTTARPRNIRIPIRE